MDDPRLWAGTIVLLTCVAFAPLFTSDFTNIDDPGTIAGNPRLNPPTLARLAEFWDPRKPQMDLYVPVTYTLWWGVARLAWLPTPDPDGTHLNPWMFHGANVALHALSALFVFSILRLLVGSAPTAAAGALLFALHPTQVEPVGWASGTKDVLYGLLSLIAILGYLLAATAGAPGSGRRHPVPETSSDDRRPSRRLSYWLATAAFILAMLAKPTAVVTPLIAAALDLLVLRRPLRLVARAIWPWMLLVVPVLIEGRLAQPARHPGDYIVPLHLRPFIAADALAFYFYKLFWPARLSFIYNRAPQAVISHGWFWWTWIVPAAAAVLVLLPLFTRKTRKMPGSTRPAAALAIFCLAVFPVLGFVPFDFQQFSTTADHYLYLAMLGPALAVALALKSRPFDGFDRLTAGGSDPLTAGRFDRLTAGRAVCIVVLAALGVRSFFQSRHWHDSFTLLEHSIGVNPWSPELYDNLSKAYADANLPQEACRWDQESVRRFPTRAAGHFDLAGDLLALNRPGEAEVQLQAALCLDPAFEPARAQLAKIRQQHASKLKESP
jgi:hypothetical protein